MLFLDIIKKISAKAEIPKIKDEQWNITMILE